MQRCSDLGARISIAAWRCEGQRRLEIWTSGSSFVGAGHFPDRLSAATLITHACTLPMPGRSIKLGPHVRHVNRLGASIAENELRAHARENYDLWGMLLGYSIRVES